MYALSKDFGLSGLRVGAVDALGPLPGGMKQQQPAQQPRGRLERQYSTASRSTVDTLDQIELEVLAMAKQSEDCEAILQKTAGDQLEASMRNELAQLHGILGSRKGVPGGSGEPSARRQPLRTSRSP